MFEAAIVISPGKLSIDSYGDSFVSWWLSKFEFVTGIVTDSLRG